jgi:uncharacterized protein YjiS (DUF1127 family)
MTDEFDTPPEDLRAGRGTIDGEIAVREQWLKNAENYGDPKRMSELRRELSDLGARREQVARLRETISAWQNSVGVDSAGRPSKNADKALLDVFEAVTAILDRA